MSAKSFVRGFTVGAGLMYLLDSKQGRVRREQLGRRINDLIANARSRFEAGDLQIGGIDIARYGARVGDIAGLGAATIGFVRPELTGESPVNAAAVRVLGGMLALYGLTRRGTMASLFRTIGTGLLVGSAGRGDFGGAVLPAADRRRAVDIQKTLHIEAPLEQVYAFWSNYENFPLFMSHVREVEDLGAGRSRLRVSGPGGMPIEWNAVLTQQG